MRYEKSIVSILLLTQYVYCSFFDDLRYIECNTKSTVEEFRDVFSNLYNRSFDLNFKFKHHFYDEENEFDERTQQHSCTSTLYNHTSPLHIDKVIVQQVTLSFKWLPQFINGLLHGYNFIKIPLKAGFSPIISNVIKTLLFHYNDSHKLHDLYYTNNYTDTNPNNNMTDTAEYSSDKISALIELGGGMGYGMQVYCDDIFVYTLGGGNGGGLEYQYKTTTTKQWNHHEADITNSNSNSIIYSDEQKGYSAYSYDHYSYGGGGGGGIQIDTNFLCNNSSSSNNQYFDSDLKDDSDRPEIDMSTCTLLSEMSSSYYDASTDMISYGGGGGCGTHEVGSKSSTHLSTQDLNTSSSTSDTTQFDTVRLDIHGNTHKTYLVCGTQTDDTYPRNMTILSIFMNQSHKKLSTCNQIRIDGGGGGGGGGVFHLLKSTCTSYDPENEEGMDLYKGYGYGYHFTMISTLNNTSTSMPTSDNSDLDFIVIDDDTDHEYDETLILHDSHIRSEVHVSSIWSTDNSSDTTNMTNVVSKNEMSSESKYVTTNLSTLSSPYDMIEWTSKLVYDYRYSYHKQRDISSTRSTDTLHISYMESKRESSDIDSILTSRRLTQIFHANKFDTPGHIMSTTYNFLNSFSFLWSSVLFEDDTVDHFTTSDTMGIGHSGVDNTSIAEIDLSDSDYSSKDVNEYVSQRNRLLHVLDPIYLYNKLTRHDSDNITADHNLNHDRQVTHTYMKYLHSVSICDYTHVHVHPMSSISLFNLTVLGTDSLSPKCIDFFNDVASLDDIVMTENWQLIYAPKIIQSLKLCLCTILPIPPSKEDDVFNKTDTPIQYEWQNDEIHIVNDSCEKDTSAICNTLNVLLQQLLDVILCPPLSLLMEEYHHTIDYMIIQLQQTICPDLWLPSLLSLDHSYHSLNSSSDEIKDGNITVENIKEDINDFTIKYSNTSQRINSSVVVEMYINIDNRTHSINRSYVDHSSTLYLYQSSQLKDQSEHDANHTNCIECHEFDIIYLMYYMIGVTATLQLLTRHYVYFYTINTDYNPHAIYIIPTTVDNAYLQV